MSSVTDTVPAKAPPLRLRWQPGWGERLFVPGVLLALCVYLSLANQYFLTGTNVENVLIQASILAIVSFGVTFVVLAGELDLSVGSGTALASVVCAMVMRDSGSILLGVLASLGVGALLGVVNGLVVTRLEVPSFIATLGMLTVASGIALHLANGQVIVGLPSGIGSLANGKLLGVNYVIWLVFVVFAVLWVVQRQTAFGMRVFATGGNPEAARLSGIPVDRIRLLAFVLVGLTVGIAGVALTARVQSGQPNAGYLLELYAVAAIVVGGTSLRGGRGSVAWTLWGVLLISTLKNGLDLQGVGEDLKQVIIGVVFIAAASVDFFRRQLARRRLRGGGEGPPAAAQAPAGPNPQ
ncbi:MAG TPA: ABC transporter permease [Conexibacter sp.]|nr:ABC transporter permease [Conexibacter sp.]